MASRRSNTAKDALARLAQSRAAQDEAVIGVAEALAARRDALAVVDKTTEELRRAVTAATKTGLSRAELATLCETTISDLAPRRRTTPTAPPPANSNSGK